MYIPLSNTVNLEVAVVNVDENIHLSPAGLLTMLFEPPIYMLPPMPTPPVTTTAPVNVLVVVLAPVTRTVLA